jgi:hypothetical protein
MKPSEMFGVVVRSVGLLLVLPALGTQFFAILSLVLGGPGNAVGMMILSLPVLLVGLWLLRGAPGIMAFAYPEK